MNNEIDIQLLLLIKDGEYHTIQQISRFLNMNYKRVQNEIDILQSYFECQQLDVVIERKKGKGIRILDRHNTLSNLEIGNNIKTKSLEDMDIKKKVIMTLVGREYTTLDSLCVQFSISRTSMLKIMKTVKGELTKHHIDVLSKSHFGYYVEAEEMSIQKYLFGILINETVGRRCKLCKVSEEEHARFSEKAISMIKNVVVDINDSELDSILVWLQIINIRSSIGKHQEEQTIAHRSSVRYEKLAENLIDFLSKTEVSEYINERNWLIKILESFDHKNDYYDHSLEIKEEYLSEIISTIRSKFGTDFSQDLELYASLRQHLSALMKRGKLGIFSKNPISHQVKAYFPLPYEMAVEAAVVIYEKTGVLINDDEISYLAVYFHLASERKKEKIQPKNILVVCPSGNSISQLMIHNITQKFGDFISGIRACGLSDLNKTDFNDFDYVFSSIPIEKNVPIPVIYIPLELKENDAESVKNYLQGEDSGYSLKDLITCDRFFTDLYSEDSETAIHQIIQNLRNSLMLSDKFEASVLERERMFTTEIDNAIAFPHPLAPYSDVTFMSLTILKRPITWNRKSVQIIFLGSVAKEEGDQMKKFYREFSAFVTSPSYISEMISIPEYDTFQKIATEIENKHFENNKH